MVHVLYKITQSDEEYDVELSINDDGHMLLKQDNDTVLIQKEYLGSFFKAVQLLMTNKGKVGT